MAQAPRKHIGTILLEQGRITKAQLEEALGIQKNSSEKLGTILVELGYATERDVLRAQAEQMGMPFLDLEKTQVDEAALKTIPNNYIQRYNAIAVQRKGNRLVVAMSDPTNVFAVDDIRLMTGLEIQPMLAHPDDITALQRNVDGGAISDDTLATALQALGVGGGGGGGELADTALTMSAGADEDIDQVRALAEEAPIIRVVNVLLSTAIKERASDIHVEPDRRGIRIRYRIDGVLHERMHMPKYVHAPLVSRIKIMSDINIAERRVPMDGRIHIRHENKDYDLRVSTLPTVFGEKAVMRILDQSTALVGLSRLGLYADMQAELERLIVQPNGMLFSTGPTGSGKTTTQYGILNRINSVEKNIITIEDPIEYQLPGINQVNVNRKAGLTFATAMRHFVRQDPDIIMVGEVRDLETAEIAVQASLTGHLVLSTLHTNDAPSAVTRLVDMGVEPFLISASIIGVLAQRLGRRVCGNCKEEYAPSPELLARLGLRVAEGQEAHFYRGRGCELCMHTGYYGRVGIFELMVMNEEIGDLIVRRAPLSEVREAAIASGMKSLKLDGFQKVLDGVTTLEEVMRVIFTAGSVF
jgi:type IV pilus assembly protein PilB